MSTNRRLLPICMLLMMVACSLVPNPPLLFGEAQTLGITINATTTTQGAELTIGYRSVDIAVIPTTVTQASGAVTQIEAKIKTSAGEEYIDGLSVLGQFQSNAQAGTAVQAGLGKFFATGQAAKVLADGFKTQLSK